MMPTFITTEELAERIKYEPRYIRERLVGEVLHEGVHFVRPFGRRKLLFLWDAIERDLLGSVPATGDRIPLASGGACRG
jgi:hypothetical protein